MNTKRRSRMPNRHTARNQKSRTRRHRRSERSLQKTILLVLAGVVAAGLLFWGGRLATEKIGEVREGAEIQETLTEAQYAIENVDTKALLNIIDPDVADPIRLLLATTGINGNEAMAKVMTALLGDDAFDTAQGALKDVRIDVTDSRIYGSDARLETLWTIDINGEEFFRYITILMEKINKKWYIVDFMVSSRSKVS